MPGEDEVSLEEIHKHWTQLALVHGGSLQATTKTWTAKALEIDALSRRFSSILGSPDAPATVLEVGCGNGANCFSLADAFLSARFDGVDFVPEMTAAAESSSANRDARERLRFFVGDALKLQDVEGLHPAYDIVFTDRCLINLNTTDLQKEAISSLATKVRHGGHLIMIENSVVTYSAQNRYRELLGLPARTPAPFNLFFEESQILPHLGAAGLELVEIEDFSSLHDLALYVLVPAINGGEVDYEHPLVEAATKLSTAVAFTNPNSFGALGQNRLYLCRKPLR